MTSRTIPARQNSPREHPFFGAIGPAITNRLRSSAITRKVRRGEVIFRRGNSGNVLFVIRVGTVKISVGSKDGREAVLHLIHNDGIFGEVSLLDRRSRTEDATAVTACELMVIDYRDILRLIRIEPDIAVRIMKALCANLRRTSEHVEDIMFLDLPGRLAKVLLGLTRKAEQATGCRTLRISQREIGEMIGISREGINIQLREWEKQRVVRLRRRSIEVLIPAALTITGMASDAAAA